MRFFGIPARKMPKPEAALGVPGDGRCLFRSVAHGAYLRAGKSSPNESLEKELADELRAKVVDEFIKRRKDTEWFLEDDFDNYIVQMRQPHVWGGEPELLMSSHVLKTAITVYMRDKHSGSLKVIAEYGQEYGPGKDEEFDPHAILIVSLCAGKNSCSCFRSSDSFVDIRYH
ncbi:OVARIAN TUMOR DOMAIN-containing deubiquitinating enzyme 4 [Turnera subulata]|uniref:Ubiquitin thioesterase OTU n=1 Tax=Turnera subulata TaxID=218843 RepID=A0A9Q0JKA4_9ROSI|nr:OVARIAN TUMOR DOMAIN-containing deubiquitinating enzyme 4 [Turnera subulata]